MTEFIKEILNTKKSKLEEKKKLLPFPDLYEMAKNMISYSMFSYSIRAGTGIIAEIRKASPSKKILFTNENIEKLGRIYQENGASAISVVTEERFFLGRPRDLLKLKKFIKIPLLRKDFIFDEYQISESKILGADAVLLIATLLSSQKLRKLLHFTIELGMEALVEIHTQGELYSALNAGAEIIGINNRNLNTLKVDLNTSRSLLPLIPDSKIKIVESGIKDERDILSYNKLKVNGFLIGEALLTAYSPGEKLKKFCSVLKKNDKD